MSGIQSSLGRVLLLGAALFTGSTMWAAELVVGETPENGGYPTIQSALDAAGPGDTVTVPAGVYHERVRFKAGGTFGDPVTLEGEPGSIIDGSTPVALDWQPAIDIGPGVYRAALDFFPFTVTANGKMITTLDETRTGDDAQDHHSFDAIRWREAFVNGVGKTGWAGVKALAMYRGQEKELLIRFQGELDPREMDITVAPRGAIISISGVNRCVVRGLTIRNGMIGVRIDRSLGSVVEDCDIRTVDYGVLLETGADRCTIRHNELSLNPYAGADPDEVGAWDNWLAMKVGGYYDRRAIGIASTLGGHRIHDNWIHDHWDGISDYGNPPWDKRTDPPIDNPGLRVHHNRLSVMQDDAFETMGASVDGQWHDSIVERARCAFRIKAPQQGPLYLYRNIFIDNNQDYRNWSQGVQLYPDAEVWVYHNTSTSDPAVTMNYDKDRTTVTPNYHYFNNLFWCREAVGKHPSLTAEPDWQGDFNVYVRVTPNFPRPWDDPAEEPDEAESLALWEAGRYLVQKHGIDLQSLWVDYGAPGFTDIAAEDISLTSSSPARNQGIPLSNLRAEPLPGFAPNYFEGDRPDAGALQYGEPMPEIPRSWNADNEPAAGSWPPDETSSD